MNDNLSKRNYAKYDRTFMAFGSIMNSFQHIVTAQNCDKITEVSWNLAKKLVSELVDELYEAEKDQEEKAL